MFLCLLSFALLGRLECVHREHGKCEGSKDVVKVAEAEVNQSTRVVCSGAVLLRISEASAAANFFCSDCLVIDHQLAPSGACNLNALTEFAVVNYEWKATWAHRVDGYMHREHSLHLPESYFAVLFCVSSLNSPNHVFERGAIVLYWNQNQRWFFLSSISRGFCCFDENFLRTQFDVRFHFFLASISTREFCLFSDYQLHFVVGCSFHNHTTSCLFASSIQENC